MNEREEIAASAATWVVEHGLDYSTALRKAAEHLGLAGVRSVEWPDHLQIEDAVREHLSIFQADRQPEDLRVLRQLALQWMLRLQAHRPHLGGAVWRGTATRHSPILLDVYTDDPTAPEVDLLNQGVRFETGQREGRGREPVPLIGVEATCRELGERVPIEISVWPTDDLRGALKPDARGASWRGSLPALRSLLESTSL